jgi:hypothetical protein
MKILTVPASAILEIAQDPTTGEHELESLANSSNNSVKALVASNPNASIVTLNKLFRDFPHEVYSNPVMTLLLLEDPNLLNEIISNAVSAMEKSLVQGQRFLRTIRESDIEKLLLHHPKSFVRVFAAKTSGEPRLLSLLSKDSDPYVRNKVAQNKYVTIEILVALAHDEIDYVAMTVAKNTNTPVEILNKFSTHPNYSVRSYAATSLRRLSKKA